MKQRSHWFSRILGAVVALFLLSGPGFTGVAADAPKAKGPGNDPSAGNEGVPKDAVGTEYLSVGDKVRITYADIPMPIPPTEQQIPTTRKITLHLNLEVEFVGKTKTQLEKEIRDLYINKGYYKNISIVIDVPVRMVSVGGEVRNPSTYAHQANLTLTKVINMAGGFTEYAKKRKVQVTRAGGTVLHVNWHDAIKDPSKDLPIHPGDRIQVYRSIF